MKRKKKIKGYESYENLLKLWKKKRKIT
jgi:hypothetical protein